jgi:hypothetical protein
MDRTIRGSEGVYPRAPGIRDDGRWRPIHPDMTRHGEYFQVHRCDRATLLVRDKGVARKSGGSVVAAAADQAAQTTRNSSA